MTYDFRDDLVGHWKRFRQLTRVLNFLRHKVSATKIRKEFPNLTKLDRDLRLQLEEINNWLRDNPEFVPARW